MYQLPQKNVYDEEPKDLHRVSSNVSVSKNIVSVRDFFLPYTYLRPFYQLQGVSATAEKRVLRGMPRKSAMKLGVSLTYMRMNGMVRTTPFTFFGMSNRVEHEKLNQVAAELPPG